MSIGAEKNKKRETGGNTFPHFFFYYFFLGESICRGKQLLSLSYKGIEKGQPC